MNEKLRKSGIDIVGGLLWGTHICQFYDSKEDLVDILIPYFKLGLENNEFCLWITAQPLDFEDAKEALRKAVPYFDSYLNKGQIEIISYTCLYVTGRIYDYERVINYWIEKLNHALESGYNGLRLSENTSWLEKKDWGHFVDYMGKTDDIISKYQIIALGSYFVDKCSTTNIVEVVSNHQFSLSKVDGKWKKTGNLGRMKAEEAAFRAVKYWEHTFDAVPDLIAIIDTKYRIVRANRAMAAKLRLAKEECIGLICYCAIHGTSEPPFFCPHQQLLNDGLEHTAEIYEDRLGGYFIVSTSPLHDSEGKLIGCINIAHDISECKVAEDKLRRSEQCIGGKLVGIIPSARKRENLLLADIIDVPMIQSLMNDFYKLAHIPMGLNDLKGNVLVSVGWQDICTKFHRAHPEASRYCVESDTKLSLNATPGELKMYKCKNNMWDIVTPIMLDGQHVGYVFSGQFFFDDDPLDYDFFRSQARKYDFNEEEYIEALNKVPRLSREAVNTSMTFFMTFANTLSQVSYSNFMLAQSLEELDVLMNALQESEEHFHTMVNAIPQLAWIARADGYIHWYNERWYSYTGTTPKQLEGWGWKSVHDPEVLPKVLEHWKASIVTGQMFDMELPLRGADGIFRSFLTRILPLKDASGDIIQWFGTSTDVTELKKAEADLKEARDSLEEKVNERTKELDKAYNLLKESGKKLAEAQKMSHIGNWEWGITTDKAYWSDELRRIFRRTSRKVDPTYNEYLSYVHPEDRAYVENAFKEAINGKPYSIDHRIILANGEERTVHIKSEAIFDEKKIPIRVKGIVQDITERKNVEEVLKLKLTELSRSNEELEQFAYVASHDLQEPLWMITGYLQLLQRRYQGELDDKADKYIHFAVDGAFRMQNLINDLLEFSRVTTTTREPEFTDCEFILNQVLSNLELFIKENNATVSKDPLPVVMADSIQLVQVFQNLIINGIKFHSEVAPKIHISVEKKAKEWVFSVQDNGIGIDPQYFKTIFEIFKRLDKREEYSGTGIGLAICRKIVERYGGHIWVESELGKGSTFYFTLLINPTAVQKGSFNT